MTIDGDFIKENTRIPESELIDYGPDIAKLRRILSRVEDSYLAGIDTLEDYGKNKKRILAEISVLEEKDRAQREAVVLPDVEEVKKRFSSVILVLEGDFDKETKQNALKSIVDRIVYDKANSTVSAFFAL